jgi:hypothetical protein
MIYQKRRALEAAIQRKRHLTLAPDEAELHRLETATTEEGTRLLDTINHWADVKIELDETSEVAASALLNELRQELANNRIGTLVNNSRRAVIDSIVRPFGLGKVVASADKRGGSVLTLHNARVAQKEGWSDDFADPERLNAFGKRKEESYNRDDYAASQEQKQAAWARSDKKDAYTGQNLKQGEVDHVVSLKEIHQDDRVAFHVSKEQVSKLGNSDSNLVVTEASINRSKKDEDIKEWMNKESTDGLGNNAEKYGVDRKLATQADSKARAEINRTIQTEAAKRYAVDAAKTGADQAVRTGFQQAVGLLLVELIEAMFDEASSLLKERPTLDKNLPSRLYTALSMVASRVLSKWKEAVAAFRDGAISGFFSNLVTMLLNLFVTTSRRVVRVIREGGYSLLQAIKMIIFPPKGMSLDEAFHEASKVFTAGLAIVGGIALEEAVEKALLSVPFLAPFAGILTAIVVGSATGLSAVLLSYAIDEIDLLGVRKRQETRQLNMMLDERIEKTLLEIEETFNEIEHPAFKL